MLDNKDLYVEPFHRSADRVRSKGVRVVHIPTQLEETCNEFLSQGTNLKVAKRRLNLKVTKRRLKEKLANIQKANEHEL